MTENRLLYYPYATMFDAQLPLLKTAALYFDKLILLDPRDASWDRVGPNPLALDEVLLLERHGLLERLNPAKVLEHYGPELADAIREDIRDPEFIRLCGEHAQRVGKHIWSLALAKVPDSLLVDGHLRSLLGELAPTLAAEMARRIDDYIEHREGQSYLSGNEDASASAQERRQLADYRDFVRKGHVYPEIRYDSAGDVLNYRYIDVPLALGEAIMVNHALFGGLLLSQATPIADDPFHAMILAHKLGRTAKNPLVRQVLEDRVRNRGLRTDLLATAALPDTDLNLPALSPDLPVDAVLEYRQDHTDELNHVRTHLAALARRIQTDPWTDDFARELDRRTIPELAAELDTARERRDDWVNRKRKQGILSAAGLATGAGAAVLTVFAAPLTPIVLAIAGLGLISGTVVPGAQWFNDWREGRATVHENGLSYLLRI
ncbi:hypothetical protein ACIBL3_00290 [Kribbella sp. NPDC050124]|uniref:hypothetical protein n=1 Tax=Kribbella sp. NPDC050124 TaxID=3364114 RepID=UPI0037A7A023